MKHKPQADNVKQLVQLVKEQREEVAHLKSLVSEHSKQLHAEAHGEMQKSHVQMAEHFHGQMDDQPIKKASDIPLEDRQKIIATLVHEKMRCSFARMDAAAGVMCPQNHP